MKKIKYYIVKAEHYAKNKKVSKNKQKNGRVPCIC